MLISCAHRLTEGLTDGRNSLQTEIIKRQSYINVIIIKTHARASEDVKTMLLTDKREDKRMDDSKRDRNKDKLTNSQP